MTIDGSKFQGVFDRVNQKLGRQGGQLIFRKKTVTESTFGAAVSTSNSDVTINSGCRVSTVSAKSVDSQGIIKEGDLRIIVPGNKITEAQLTGAVVLYDLVEYSIVSRGSVGLEGCPPILGDEVINWEIFARRKG